MFQGYEKWRHLAEQEGEAIRAANWTGVQRCQEALQALQPEIIRWTQEARAEWHLAGPDLTGQENSLRSVIGELIELERRNSSWLGEVRAAADSEWSAMQQAGATLRQVQRSYAPVHGSAWTSFS